MPLIRDWYGRFGRYFAQHSPKFYGFCERRKSVIKFVVSGCFAGGSDLVFLYLFHGLFGWNIVISTSSAFILAFLVSFTLQKFWTFRDYQDKVIQQLFFYILNALIGLYLNGYFMHVLVDRYAIWYILSQVIVNLALAFWNFVVYKFIIFKNPAKNEIKSQ